MTKIKIQKQIININKEYISLTDIAKQKSPKNADEVIKNWIRSRGTINFLGIWERMNNRYFKTAEFDRIINEFGDSGFVLSSKKWIKLVNAIGLTTKTGRYGGTFAHKDIALDFASWISGEFRLYLIKEFQRLKKEESYKDCVDWNIRQYLTKINYKININSIKENIVIPNRLSQKDTYIVYAGEADILNMALFGVTMKDWKINNQSKIGSMRDYANVYQLICLSILESLNSEFIKMHMSQKERLFKLNDAAISQMKSLLLQNNTLKKYN